jgi:UDP-N-acetylmuramate--alanine ligase
MLGGIHNVYNTLAVIAALNEAGYNDMEKLVPYFSSFSGMGRRFQKVGEIDGIQLYDDYAHHPTEIKATLESAAQKFGKEHVVAVFQPHRYTRLKSLWNEFKQSFENSRRVIVTDIYAASEDKIDGVSSERFVSEMSGAEYLSGSMEDVAKKLLPTLQKGDIVIGLGAGTITNLGKSILKANGDLACK